VVELNLLFVQSYPVVELRHCELVLICEQYPLSDFAICLFHGNASPNTENVSEDSLKAPVLEKQALSSGAPSALEDEGWSILG
jgi:hypothetical protein